MVEQAGRDGIERIVTGAILVRSGADPGRFLLLERRADDFLGGIYELPGGEVEARDPVEVTLTEHASYVWVGIEELEELPVTENVKEIIKRALI